MFMFLKKIFQIFSTSQRPENLQCISVFETKMLSARLSSNMFGSVNSSPLRRLVAQQMGFILVEETDEKKKKARTRIKDDADGSKEKILTRYINSGYWSWRNFSTLDASQNFRVFASRQLNPLLGKENDSDQISEISVHKDWIGRFDQKQRLNRDELDVLPNTPAVVAFFHQSAPKKFRR